MSFISLYSFIQRLFFHRYSHGVHVFVILGFGYCSKTEPSSLDHPISSVNASEKNAPKQVGKTVDNSISSYPMDATNSFYPVFDLLDNRFLAHIEKTNGILLLTNSAGFLKYLPFAKPSSLRGWHFPATLDGKTLALAKSEARLQIPGVFKGKGKISLWMKLQVKEPEILSVRLSGKVTSVHVKPGWQTIQIELPEQLISNHENQVLLEFSETSKWSISETSEMVSASAAIEWIYIGDDVPHHDNVLFTKKTDGIVIPNSTSLNYYISIPKDSFFLFEGIGKNCKMDLLLEGRHFQKSVSIAKIERGMISFSDLLPNKLEEDPIVKFGLQASSSEGVCDAIEMGKAQIVQRGAVPSIKRVRPRNVIFWLSDDTRADKFQLWNAKSRVKTPNLDAFSEKATRFSIAYSQGNESRVSHASLFTGQYPAKHNFIDEKAILNSQLSTLPKVFKQAGMYTVGHTANGYLAGRWGFGEGWNLLHNHIREGGGLKAEDLIAEFEQFLTKQSHSGNPFFYFLGSIDAHTSWRPHEPWLSMYDPNPYTGPLKKGFLDPQLDRYVAGQLTLSERDKTHAIALYDSDISYTDEQFGKLIELLKKTGHLEDTMIVFTSDHGEEFWDHGKIGHGQSLHPELIHVPLWIYYPPLFPAGKVVEDGVELIDLFTTLTDAFQIESPHDVQGMSLISLAQGVGNGYPRPAISSRYELAHTMRIGSYKIHVGGAGEAELFHIISDPLERNNLADKEPVPLRFLGDSIRFFLMYQKQWNKTKFGTCNNQTNDFVKHVESQFQK